MSHLDAGTLNELLDGEIPSTQLAPITAHLESCAECRARLEEERALIADSAELVEAIVVPASAAPLSPPRTTASRRTTWPRTLAWAATVVFAAGLGYAAHPLLTTTPAPARETTLPTGNSMRADQPGEPLPAARGAVAVAPPSAPPKEVAARKAITPRQAPAEAASPQAKSAASDVANIAPPASAPALLPPAASGGGRGASARADSLDLRIGSANRLVPRDARVDAIGGGRGRGVALSAERSRELPIDTIALPEAMRRLGGTIRLIDGLVPLRLEAQGEFVRVIYPSSAGELVLQQQLVDGRVLFTLRAPPTFPADSLARLRERVRP